VKAERYLKEVRLFGFVADKQPSFGEMNFGFCLHEGVGVGQFKSRLCCSKGESVSMNLAEAGQSFKVSAHHGHPPAQFAYCISLSKPAAFPLIAINQLLISSVSGIVSSRTTLNGIGFSELKLQFKSNLSNSLGQRKAKRNNDSLQVGNAVFSDYQTIHGIRVSCFGRRQPETNIEDDQAPTRCHEQ
jgi:hypothetical protein